MTYSLVEREPVRLFMAVVAAVVNLGIVVAENLDWLDLTPWQTTGLAAFVVAVCVIASEALRRQVYSPATVDEMTRPTT